MFFFNLPVDFEHNVIRPTGKTHGVQCITCWFSIEEPVFFKNQQVISLLLIILPVGFNLAEGCLALTRAPPVSREGVTSRAMAGMEHSFN